MNLTTIKSIDRIKSNTIILCNETNLSPLLNDTEKTIVKRYIESDHNQIELPGAEFTTWVFIFEPDYETEDFRQKGNEAFEKAKKLSAISIDLTLLSRENAIAFAEGLSLSSYSFLKYFKNEDKEKEAVKLEAVQLLHSEIATEDIEELKATNEAVFWARNMINEPVNAMNSVTFAKEVSEKLTTVGVEVEVLDKRQIESLRMGGLLAVNKGSIDPPTFTIAIWKPENAVNEKPYALIGKGIMFDTGGLSIKPTPGSMDSMKSDMSGAAGIAGAMYNIAKQKLPVYVVALLPATDNRPSGNAYTPGDIIKMFNGLHVEVLNTDAEGRMILADAISYADKYDPQLVLDMATLTGSAAVAIGDKASVVMGTAANNIFNELENAGNMVYERVVRFPFYKEYDRQIKSKIADLKNIGGRDAGAITAGKFLANFTEKPFVHIDIAGPAFINEPDGYRTLGGTGYGVRLLTQFFKNISKPVKKS